MNPLRTQTARQTASLTQKLFRLERCGRYVDALEELADIWPDFELPPEIEGFEPGDAAEILLRCGSLYGFHGHTAQIPNAQDCSRDLLMAARESFLVLGNLEKAAECENYLALAYWRTGEQKEAQTWVDESLSRPVDASNPTRLYSYIIQCLTNLSTKRVEENLARLNSLETTFLGCNDDCLKGDFYNHRGLALKNLGQKSKALRQYELARYYHQRSKHRIFLATVENNLANLYKESGLFKKAYESINNAARLFKQLKDKTREGFALDTKALLFLAESRYPEALKTAEKAIAILRKSENLGYLSESLLTKARILVYLDNFSDAVLSLVEAVNIARVQTGEELVKRMINEFEGSLNERNAPKPKKNLSDDGFQIILPKSVSEYEDYLGVSITTDHLERVGLKRGTIAIVAVDEVKRGDLVAVVEIATDEAVCGFYDSDFGIVCLEGKKGEPDLFDEKEVKILGKIVGVCDSKETEDGKLVVRTLSL